LILGQTPITYDVIIAGAGPAGATAAYFLGEAGKSVLVLEKEKLPRYKACGGGVSIRFLQSVFPFSFEPVVESRVSKVSYAFDGRTVTIPCEGGGLAMVMREELDSYILSHAKVEVKDGTAIRKVEETGLGVAVETRDDKRYEAQYLIGADGTNSVVAHYVDTQRIRRNFPAIEVEVPVSAELMARYRDRPLFIFNKIRWGYLWIFPKAEHLSVGVATLHPKPGQLQDILKRVMAEYGINVDKAPLHGHLLPLYTPNQPVMTRRILLAGDAAGLADPLSGEGIRPAIRSGRLAAEAILSGKVDGYAAQVRRTFGVDQRFSLLAGKIFYRLEKLCLILGAPNPYTTHAIMDVLAGEAGGFWVMGWAIISLPAYILVEAAAGLAQLFKGAQSAERFRRWAYRGSLPRIELQKSRPES
jgi:geranylgeranyl reductase family protein